MNARHLLFAAGAVLATACSSQPYVPEPYPIKDVQLDKFSISGEVTVENFQTDTGTHVLIGYQPPVLGSYATITQSLVEQLQQALDKDGLRSQGGVAKKLRVSVCELGTYVPAGASTHHVTWLDIAVGLGDAPPAMIQVVTKTGDFTVASYHAYEHATSLAVLEILKNKDVLAYLAQSGATPPSPPAPK